MKNPGASTDPMLFERMPDQQSSIHRQRSSQLSRRRSGKLFPDLPVSEFDIIYADPPWDYKGQLQHAGEGSCDTGGAIRHYGTVTLDDLKRLRVDRIAAENSLLFLWATNPHLDQAIDLGKSWGFMWVGGPEK